MFKGSILRNKPGFLFEKMIWDNDLGSRFDRFQKALFFTLMSSANLEVKSISFTLQQSNIYQ